jgi:hypothetical protein
MIEAVVLSLIFLDVGIMAVLLGKASKRLQPTEKLAEEESFLFADRSNFEPHNNSQNYSMNEPINRLSNPSSNPNVNPSGDSPTGTPEEGQLWQWEFKIVRGSVNGFRGRESLHYVCEQERKAGWILLEKLDNQRLRFRRPIAARKQDHLCRQDPYRTYYGMPPEVSSFISLLVVLALLGIPTYWGFGFIRKQLSDIESKPIETSPSLPKQPLKKP